MSNIANSFGMDEALKQLGIKDVTMELLQEVTTLVVDQRSHHTHL